MPPAKGARTKGAAARASSEAQLGQVMDRMLDAMRQGMISSMREYDLTPPMVMTLKMVEEPRSMRWLADIQQCDASNITGIVDRLEKRGLVERRSDPNDRRITLVARTELGNRLPASFIESGVRTLSGLSDLDDTELETLVKLLRRLVP